MGAGILYQFYSRGTSFYKKVDEGVGGGGGVVLTNSIKVNSYIMY